MEISRVSKQIAIIGLGCRFPGGSDSPEKFWDLMKQSKNAVIDIPQERWQVNRFYNESDSSAAKSYVRKGHFIDWDYTTFDANFFDFAPLEVEYFDPQQRLLLEVSWEAMENSRSFNSLNSRVLLLVKKTTGRCLATMVPISGILT